MPDQVNPRLKVLKGLVDDQSVLSFTPKNIANSGESMVTELEVELEDQILSSYRIYFEFLLPTRERFISEPLSASMETVDSIDPSTNLPTTRQALIVRYKVPRYVALIEGTILVNLKATNDSVTIYKSKVEALTVDSSVNSENSDRYFSGDLLDWLVMRKVDDMKYVEGWLETYTTNPATGEQEFIARYPINPLFESEDAAADWAMNSGEATKGQLLTVVFQQDDDPYAPDVTTAYLINPDMTLSRVMTQGASSYDDLLDLPKLDTTTIDGSLEPQASEVITGKIKLAKVSKTGRMSDLINDEHFAIIHTHKVRSAGSPVVDHEIAASQDGEYLLNLQKVIFNVGLNEGDQILIEIGSDETSWRQMLSQDDIDVTLSATSYVVDQSYGYTLGEHFRVSVVSDSSNISIDIVTNHG